MNEKNPDDVFVSRVAHDLRGELATMVAGVHYLLRYEADLAPSARQMLERVNGAGQRLRRLLDEFDNTIWIGRSSASATANAADAASLNLEPTRLRLVVDAALGRLSHVIAAREATVDVRIADDLPEFQADPELLGIAVEYLIDFALARSHRQPVRITGSRVDGVPVLAVADRGGVVAPALLDVLLEPFGEREAVPRTEPGQRRRERLGLGLAIARGIFAAHGGGLVAEAVAEAAAGAGGIVLRADVSRL